MSSFVPVLLCRLQAETQIAWANGKYCSSMCKLGPANHLNRVLQQPRFYTFSYGLAHVSFHSELDWNVTSTNSLSAIATYS